MSFVMTHARIAELYLAQAFVSLIFIYLQCLKAAGYSRLVLQMADKTLWSNEAKHSGRGFGYFWRGKSDISFCFVKQKFGCNLNFGRIDLEQFKIWILSNLKPRLSTWL